MKFIIMLFLFSIALLADKDHYHINKELSHLDLSKEQSAQIREVLKDFRAELKEFEKLKEDMEYKKKELFLKENLDTAQLDKFNSRLDARAGEIEVNFLKKVHTILHPKQRERFIYYFDDWEVK